MALEVQANGYLFADPPEDSDGSSDEDGDASSDEEGAGFEEDIGSSAEVLFLHNYLHDVEGIWWIMIYNLYYTQPRNSEHEPAEWEQKQRIATAETIFPPSISGSTRREHFVTTKRRYVDCTKTLPPEFKALGRAMDKVRRVLLRHYRSLEYPSLKDVLDAYEKYGKIYRKLITRFKKMKKYAVESVVELGAATEEDVRVSKRTMCGNKRKNNDDGEYQPPKKTRTNSTEASRRNPGARRVTASKTPIAMEEGSEDEDMH
ncbi:hypothetical protein PQX77_005197 [Marasmius sp. AFHP31]|nr:hypothetical protein PQX77_005197 [Marasmius sp. AFHP31]